MESRTVLLTVKLEDSRDLNIMQFQECMSIFYACSSAWDKLKNNLSGQQASMFGFFKTNDDNPAGGYWLQMDKTIGFYKLKNGETLEYRKLVLTHCVRLLDDTIVTLPLNNSAPVSDLVKDICRMSNLNGHEELSLTVDRDFPVFIDSLHLRYCSKKVYSKLDSLKRRFYTSPKFRWLLSNATLTEQGINHEVVLTLRRKFFSSIDPVDINNSEAVDTVYMQNKRQVTGGALLCSYKEAVKLAGLQCQVTFGEHNPRKNKPGTLIIEEYLPDDYAKSKDSEKTVWAEHCTLRDLSEFNAKLCYIRFCHSLPTFGAHFVLVRESAEDRSKLVPCLLGISKKGVMRADPKTKNILTSWPISSIRRWTYTSECFLLDFGNHKNRYQAQTDEPILLCELISGYVDVVVEKNTEQCTMKRQTTEDTMTDKTQTLDQQETETRCKTLYTPINCNYKSAEPLEDQYVQIGTKKIQSSRDTDGLPQLPMDKSDALSTCSSITCDDGKQKEDYLYINQMSLSASNSTLSSLNSQLSDFRTELGSTPSITSTDVSGLDWQYPNMSLSGFYTTLPGTGYMSCQQKDSQSLTEKLLSTQAELQKTRQVLAFAEQRAILAEQRAMMAEQRAALAEQRAIFAEHSQLPIRQWHTLPHKRN